MNQPGTGSTMRAPEPWSPMGRMTATAHRVGELGVPCVVGAHDRCCATGNLTVDGPGCRLRGGLTGDARLAAIPGTSAPVTVEPGMTERERTTLGTRL